MRISTNMMYEIGSRKIGDLQHGLVKTQQQLSTQKRVLTPADDPVAAASILGITQSLSMNEQFAVNRQNAKNYLSQEESILQSVTSLLQDAKTLVVNAGNGAMEDSQRKFLSAELRGRVDELLGLANSRDGAGNFMFGGFQISSQPFSAIPTGAQYNGDQGQRMLQIGASRHIALNDTGSSVFENIKTGNGRTLTAAVATNTGGGIVSAGAVVDPAALTGHNYTIEFSVDPVGADPLDPLVTTYTVRDEVTGFYMNPATKAFDVAAPIPLPPAGPRIPYVSGQSITFDGVQLDIKGAPATGDKFTLESSENQSIFETLNTLIQTLEMNAVGAAGQAKLTNGLNAANNNIDNALANVLSVRASVGTRLKEIDVLDSTGDDLNVQYTEAMRALEEIDLAEAISNFTQQQITLEAAQKSFLQISRLSLFNYI
ncbi:flagellar hook-associated protein FlgL [Herbaspirillum sp. GCM10030257]|uniref:flagellar hook-associated protein FlgL n=1 Tax=Herbaspirillum sp. GCM10030257 TaxID=3273393 RepID=UPI00361FE198